LTNRRDSQTQTPQSDPAHVISETQFQAGGKNQKMEKPVTDPAAFPLGEWNLGNRRRTVAFHINHVLE
jgi:hypothetical protein